MNTQDQSIAQAVKAVARTFDPTAKVVFFGSRVRGTHRTDSDYDFLILFHIPVSFQLKTQVLDKLYDVELQQGCVLGVLIENAETWEMHVHTPIFSAIRGEGIAV